jgi:ribosome modulation factor
MTQSEKWREMGRKAARQGKSKSACPYVEGGTAWSFWIAGYNEIRP